MFLIISRYNLATALARIELDNRNKAVKRPIKLGRQNTENFEVLSGLEPGDRVITSSYSHFGDNEVLVW